MKSLQVVAKDYIVHFQKSFRTRVCVSEPMSKELANQFRNQLINQGFYRVSIIVVVSVK